MKYEDWKQLNANHIATRVRDLHDTTIAMLMDNVVIMLDSGQYPKEVFHEVRWVQKLLWDLKTENEISAQDENETYN
jgi:hypothetical protein